jgi:hypothetical protein
MWLLWLQLCSYSNLVLVKIVLVVVMPEYRTASRVWNTSGPKNCFWVFNYGSADEFPYSCCRGRMLGQRITIQLLPKDVADVAIAVLVYNLVLTKIVLIMVMPEYRTASLVQNTSSPKNLPLGVSTRVRSPSAAPMNSPTVAVAAHVGRSNISDPFLRAISRWSSQSLRLIRRPSPEIDPLSLLLKYCIAQKNAIHICSTSPSASFVSCGNPSRRAQWLVCPNVDQSIRKANCSIVFQLA